MAIFQDSSDPTGIKDTSVKGGSDVMRARDRKANAALQMRLAGATWEEVAQVIGYPTARGALVATEKALERELHTDTSQAHLRSMAGMRLDRLLRSVWAKAIDPNHPDQMVAVVRARELIDRHAKLYGLDAPTQMVVHSPTQHELERWVSTVVQAAIPQIEEYDIFDLDEEPELNQIEVQ